MTRWLPTDIVGGAYKDDTRAWSAQDTCNYMVVAAEKAGTRSASLLRCCPGLYELANSGNEAPARGLHNVEGLLLAVIGTTLYSVDTKFVCHAIGTIPGVGRVSMAHNQVTGGYQVAIANGQSGYVYSTVDGSLIQITDDGFPGSISFAYGDSYILGIEPGRRYAFTSDLASATSYNTLDRYEAEASPDLLIGQAVRNSDWWLFGDRTTEIFSDSGQATGTWQRIPGTVMEVGAASPWCISNLDNSIFWLGSDGIVYRANGYSPQRVSTAPIEQAISRCTLGTSFSFVFEDRGHKIYYLTLTDGHTWGYDVATQEWHRRESYGMTRWVLNDLVRWNGMWVGGHLRNGKIYAMDWDTQAEGDQPLVRYRTTGVLSDNQNALIVNGIEIVVDTGLPLTPAYLDIDGDVPDGKIGDTDITTYTTDDGKAPYSFDIVSGQLPTGKVIATGGKVSGSRTASGVFEWVVRVTDSKGRRGSKKDKSFTADNPIPPITGSVKVIGQGNNVEPASGITTRGAWHFVALDQDIHTGDNTLYIDGVLVSTKNTGPIASPRAYPFTVGNSTYPDFSLNGMKGMISGAGVMTGGISAEEVAYLFNSGSMRSFDALSSSPDAMGASIWSRLYYAWQLDEAGGSSRYKDMRGRADLTVTGQVGAYVDANFGRVSRFNRAGRLTTIDGSFGPTDWHRTMFAWFYSEMTEVLPDSHQDVIMGNYDSISEGKLISLNSDTR